jgi:hypothetical protein
MIDGPDIVVAREGPEAGTSRLLVPMHRRLIAQAAVQLRGVALGKGHRIVEVDHRIS